MEMISRNWSQKSQPAAERNLEMKDSLNLLDTVVATVDLPEQQVLSGDLGTIVEVYEIPSRAYEVDFVNPDSTTRALLTLTPDQVRPLAETDVLTTHPLSVAA